VGEYNTAGAMLARYVHGMAEDDPVIWYNGATMDAGTRRYLHADQQGSIVAVSDASGNAITLNSYDEYGIPGSTNLGEFQYTGQVWLPEIGLYYYKARMYSPTLGRFMQTDPIGYKDQNNLYAYVGDDPVDGTDPSGLLSCPPACSATDVLKFGEEVVGEGGRAAAAAGVIVETAAILVTAAAINTLWVNRAGNPDEMKAVNQRYQAAEAARKRKGRSGDFSKGQRNSAKAANAARNGGKMRCEDCKEEVRNIGSQKGVPTPNNQAQVHHDPAISNGGGTDSTPVILCPPCHRDRHEKE
jgi:RHS repeat-associated protein